MSSDPSVDPPPSLPSPCGGICTPYTRVSGTLKCARAKKANLTQLQETHLRCVGPPISTSEQYLVFPDPFVDPPHPPCPLHEYVPPIYTRVGATKMPPS